MLLDGPPHGQVSSTLGFNMAEFIIKEPFRPGHIPDTYTTVLDLYRLLSAFYSSKKFAELNSGLNDDPINYLLQFETSEITRILTSTAITTRITAARQYQML